MAIKVRDAINRDWIRRVGHGRLGIGYDVATTQKEMSNPSSVTVTEEVAPFYVERLVLRWKTKDPDVAMAVLQCVFDDIMTLQRAPARMCVDASNERYFAQKVQKRFSRYCPVQLIVSGEKIEWQGEEFDYKTFLGNLYVNTFTDGRMRMPDVRWLKDDRRLVKKDAGRFVTDLAPDGSHGDTFDSGKLARFGLEGRGRAEIAAVPVGMSASPGSQILHKLKNPLLQRALREQRNRRTPHA